MKMMRQVSFLFLLFLFVSTASAQQPTRLWDDEVERLIDEAYKTSDKFRDEFKKVSAITTRGGIQIDVKKYMSDYKETFERFKDGFDSQHTPNSDLVNLLRMTSEIDGVMTRNPDAAGAGSEWQAHKFNMERMAQAFHTNVGEDTRPPGRMSDDQTKQVMEALQEGSKSLGKSVEDEMKKDTSSIDESTREAVEESFELLGKKAEIMKNLFDDKKPLSVEMQEFLKQLDRVRGFLTEHPLSSTVQTQWDTLERKTRQLTEEFGITS